MTSPASVAAALLAIGLIAPLAAADAPRVEADDVLILGEAPEIHITGLDANETVTVHAFRRAERWAETSGQWRATPTLAHAWARFRANVEGRVDVDADRPLEGSYAGADAFGLLWSGFAGDAAEVAELPRPADALPADISTWSLRVERDGAFVARRDVALRDFGESVRVEDVAFADARSDGGKAGVAGVFAVPADASALPTLILLHGSEGANPADARRWAGRMAERGFAAFALHYVAYDWNGGIDGVNPRFDNVPVETLDAARAWLATRSEVDADRIGVLGISKGAELALVGATRYPWLRAVVACVPSDVVWGGWGREPKPGEVISSWSWQGAPLPAIPYDNYEDAIQRRITWTTLHERSRNALDAEDVTATRIPVERIDGRVLLIGGGRDEIWPSLPMAEAVATTLREAGKADRVEIMAFPEAGHGICNAGGRLERFDPTPADPAAEAKANVQAFARSVEFLREALSAPASTPAQSSAQ